jgi:diaminohydroxyphosphoribosylaminopyrimidine deaminase/5-amino-6-(5-phosphoribosylamino)uracil reductase
MRKGNPPAVSRDASKSSRGVFLYLEAHGVAILSKGETRKVDVADAAFMETAFELARRGRGSTSPNPVVGAVVVRDGEVVGAGYHERYGGAHAEVNALREAGEKARGATIYVTLEPCSVSGKTPPCTDAILAAGVARTVVPIEDPNPDVSGRGLAILREAGVSVDCGLMRDEARALNAPYFKYRGTGLPFVTLKLALSLDGRIAPPSGGPRWTSSAESRVRVHAMRADSDCVLVGVGTALADDPRLTDRRDGERHDTPQPARLVFDTHLRIRHDLALVTTARETRTIVACGRHAEAGRRAVLEELGVAVWPCATSDGHVDPEDVIRRAAEEGLISILAEGGPSVAGSLLNAGLVDRVAFFVAPRLYGADGTPALPALDGHFWNGTLRFANSTWTVIGDDCLFEADVAAAKTNRGEE